MWNDRSGASRWGSRFWLSCTPKLATYPVNYVHGNRHEAVEAADTKLKQPSSTPAHNSELSGRRADVWRLETARSLSVPCSACVCPPSLKHDTPAHTCTHTHAPQRSRLGIRAGRNGATGAGGETWSWGAARQTGWDVVGWSSGASGGAAALRLLSISASLRGAAAPCTSRTVDPPRCLISCLDPHSCSCSGSPPPQSVRPSVVWWQLWLS